MGTYFADTSFWIAITRKRDQHHQRAISWHQFIIQSQSTIITTEAVLWEWLNALSDVSTRIIAAEGYRRAHADAGVEIVSFFPELIVDALDLYRSRNDKNWSLTDCLSFVVMKRRGLTEALTTDHHFEQSDLKPMMLQAPLR